MAAHYDAVVLGLGGMGSAALAHLATRGYRVLGLEQYEPVHAYGSSHGQSRIIRQAYFEHPAYVPLLLSAYALWAVLERKTGRTLLLKTGGLMVGEPGCDIVSGSARSAREHSLEHQILTANDMRRRFPAMHPLDHEVGLYEPDAGLLVPEEAIRAHLEVAAAAGAHVRFQARVSHWDPLPGGGVRVAVAGESFTAGHLVICAGAWFGAVASDLGIPLQVERNVMHWFEPAGPADQFAPGALPIYLVERAGAPVLYGFPHLPGQGLKAAFHHSRVYTDPESVDRAVHPAEAEPVRDALSRWMPAAAGAWRGGVACLYTNTPDEHFVIGAHPGHPQVIVAGGFSGHGFKFCTVVGEILADLVISGTTSHPIGLFSPARFQR